MKFSLFVTYMWIQIVRNTNHTVKKGSLQKHIFSGFLTTNSKCSRDLLDKPIVAHLIKIFSAFFGTRRSNATHNLKRCTFHTKISSTGDYVSYVNVDLCPHPATLFLHNIKKRT